jgi:predicted membrane-bound mannosyltransferase/sugar lactone lactonase YvrE
MDATNEVNRQEKTSALDRPLQNLITLNWATVLFIGILLVTIISRYAMLGERVQSHDETSHVYFSWLLEQGRGYKHDPVTHGPLQFHLIALSYFLFGDNDFSARIPHALASILTVAFMWNYRRYLGKVGWLIAAFLFMISPYMLYYGRYARNEAFVALFTVVALWAILRYFDTGTPRYLFWFTAATVLHFTSKETAYIYAAQALIFLALFFLFRVTQSGWARPENRSRFAIALLLAVLLFLGALAAFTTSGAGTPEAVTTPAYPATVAPTEGSFPLLVVALAGLGAVVLIAAVYFLFQGYTLQKVRAERSFDLLILLGTFVLPMLAPFPVKLLGWDPLDYSSQGMLRTSLFLIPLALISIGIGLWWNRRLWLGNAALFYAIYVVFYTTIFTNGAGFFTGIVGSLGYWLVQQGVERGSQPWYYYLFLQIPIYEFLPALGSLLAFGLALFGKRGTTAETESSPDGELSQPESQRLAVTLLGYWVITSAIAYTYAGEKMPWLTVHIALPMILLSGWSFGWLIESVDWGAFRARRGILVVLLILVFLVSLAGVFGSLLGDNPPFQGKQLGQLQATSTFFFSMLMAIASGGGLIYLLRIWPARQIVRLLALTFFGLLALLTARTSYTASFINYNFANEYLVYAHSGPGAKLIMNQVDDISQRLTDGNALVVAYDDKTTYPFWWYLRNYPNARFFGDSPTRDLRDVPVIIAGSDNYGKIEPVVGQAFYPFEYIRMWWPNQDYTALTWENINNQRTRELMADQAAQGISDPLPPMGVGEYLGRAWSHLSPIFTDPQVRQAVWEIWLNRDFTSWAALSERDMSLPNWQPSEKMRMYVRKDVAAQIWNYGVGPSSEEVIADPYEGKEVILTADSVIGSEGSSPGQFKRPRDLAFAPDGTLYVADTDNHRIQHLNRDGSVLHTWGSFADISQGAAPGGTFYEPWGIAVDEDGFVYVADTWNHRVQKFTPEGEFVKMWGYFGQAEQPDAFWGPRDVAIDPQGRVLVSDTGNKRIVSFDADGNFVFEFGGQGFEAGEFYEPVGLTVDNQGRLFVADTWNQRIQSFQPGEDGSYQPLQMWDVSAWYGQSLDNKPYLAVDDQGHVFATDPEGYRVLEFTETGEIVRFWGDYSLGNDGFGLVGSVAVDPQSGVWVSDAGNHRLMHFTLPQE